MKYELFLLIRGGSRLGGLSGARGLAYLKIGLGLGLGSMESLSSLLGQPGPVKNLYIIHNNSIIY